MLPIGPLKFQTRHPACEGTAQKEAQCSSSLAFVVAVHRPKFAFFCALLHSNQMYSNAIFGVFSSHEQATECPCLVNVTSLIVKPDERNVVTSKKWEAVKHVFDHYSFDAVVAIDAESRFRRRATSQDIVDFSKGIITYGPRPAIRVYKKINEESCRAVNLKDPPVAYLWWGNLPMYTRDHFYEFYRSINTTHLNYFVFDHASYLCYLAVVKGQRVVHTDTFLEEGVHCTTSVDGVPLLWVYHRACVNNQTLLTFHHDRG